MKAIICKFFNERGVEQKMAQLVFKQRRRANNLRIFCVEERIQRKLKTAGIESEVFDDFRKTGGADDESSWGKVYQISDRLHFSTEKEGKFKYSGINFLTLEHEYFPYPYILLVRFSNLCRRMASQNCEVLILVLTGFFNTAMPEVNSPGVKTVKYGNFLGSLLVTRFLRFLKSHGNFKLRNLSINPLNRARRKTVKVNYSVAAEKPDRKVERVLFVVSTALYARPSVAIIKECQRNNIITYVATDDRALPPLFQSQNIECFVKPLFPGSFFGKTVKIVRLIYWLSRHVDSLDKEGHNSNGKSDDFSAAHLCQKTLLRYLPFLCYLAVSDIIFMERLIKTTAPELICLMPDGRFMQQMAAALAKKYNIPTLSCNAAVETGNARAYMRHLHADKAAVMGEVIKKMYMESGVDSNRIVVTGIAHFDLLFNRDKDKDKQVLLGSNIDPGKRIILFTTDNIPFSETERMLTGVINAILKMHGFELVVKVHPAEGIEGYRAMAEKYHDSRIHVVKDTDLHALISSCELLITKYSTTALEAMMAGKPVVTINLPGQPTPVPYAKEGAALGVYRFEDIEQTIRKVLNDEEARSKLKEGRDRFVRYWAGEPDGKASQRIVSLMKGMIASAK
jgi:UDP-N-acetylglucosamine 2-epimerase